MYLVELKAIIIPLKYVVLKNDCYLFNIFIINIIIKIFCSSLFERFLLILLIVIWTNVLGFFFLLYNYDLYIFNGQRYIIKMKNRSIG